MKKTSNQGFTLVEMMVVLAIIGILSGIALQQYKTIQIRSFMGATISAARSMELAQAAFYTEYFQYAAVATTDASASGSISKTINLNRGGTQNFIFASGAKVTVLCKTGNGETSAIVAARHEGADRIIAADMDVGSKMYKLQSTALLDADIPASSSVDDLTGWLLQ